MVDCPNCGTEMKIGAMQFDQPLYNCDNCGLDCWRPPEGAVAPPKEAEVPSDESQEVEKPPKKKKKKK